MPVGLTRAAIRRAAVVNSLDGSQTDQAPSVASVNAALDDVGTGSGDMLKADYDSDDDGKVDAADEADAAPWSGITGKPSTFTPSAHEHPQSEVTGLTASLAAKADLVGGFVQTSQIPALAITEFLGTVASQSAMLALTGDRGDWCIRTDTGTVFILNADDSSLIASWTEVEYPSSPVVSVNGQTGTVVLGALDVGAAAVSHNQAASTISDSTAVGRSVLTAADSPAARSALGLVIGTDVLAPNGDASGLQNIPTSASLPPLLPLARVATLMGSSLNPAGTTQPSVVLVPNRIAFWLSQPTPAFTSLTLQITVLTAQAGGKVRVGMYNRASDCGPGTLIGEGELDASSTGNKSITIACTNTETGIKWLAINANVSSISVRGHALQSSLGRLSGGYAWYDTIYRALTYGAHPANETSQATYTPLEATFPEIMWRGV